MPDTLQLPRPWKRPNSSTLRRKLSVIALERGLLILASSLQHHNVFRTMAGATKGATIRTMTTGTTVSSGPSLRLILGTHTQFH
ncbi:unnamed protein product [Acanthoscelides obtectus]|uniref:Uncharacterized protein n=1 Tax=Acanthoscelides obtectus TaxID=200917 RepID=A0A9P0LJT2_ACAOB|nr:unnamed protein product [Acanthoscelides obtectus]CAK1628681.1 hypothetical protein AOBTE_LOCUS5344 [Acanthoscelides obtectus]